MAFKLKLSQWCTYKFRITVDVEHLKYLLQIPLLCQANLSTLSVSLNLHAYHVLYFTKILHLELERQVLLQFIYYGSAVRNEHIVYIQQ